MRNLKHYTHLHKGEIRHGKFNHRPKWQRKNTADDRSCKREGSDEIFDVSVVDFIDIIRFNVGDEVTVEYKKGEQVDTVLSLNGKSSEQISTKAEKEEKTEDTAGDSAQTE